MKRQIFRVWGFSGHPKQVALNAKVCSQHLYCAIRYFVFLYVKLTLTFDKTNWESNNNGLFNPPLFVYFWATPSLNHNSSIYSIKNLYSVHNE